MNQQQKGPRRHHWRPQWYLKGFSIPDNSERCHALNVVSGQAIENTHVKNLAVEKDFYRFADDFSGIEPQVSQLDGIVSRIFSEIVSENKTTFRNQEEYEYKTEMILRFMAHMMAFDPAVRDGIINAAKMIAPEDITDKDDVESIPMHIVSYIEYLGIIRNMGRDIGFKIFTASDDNFFICPDVIDFTVTYDGELHLCFPIYKNLCLYGCSSKEVLETLNPSVPQINTMLLLHSRQFVYFPSWDLKIDNGISEISIKDLVNKGIDEMIETWLQKNPTIINPHCPTNIDRIFHTIEKRTPDDAKKEASAYIEKTISDINSDIYAMCLVHDENYDGRSPLDSDKFIEITREVSKLADLNIKHFCSKDMTTVFFRMHESNDGSSMTLRVAKRDDINTAEDTLNAQIVCNIMPIKQWVDAVTDKIYDNEGVRIATEMAESVKCPIHARQAHTFLSEFVSHTQMELNGIRELSKQGRTTSDMEMPYCILSVPEANEGTSVENCNMSDITNKINSLMNAQWIDTITDSLSLNEIFQSGEILIPHSDNNLSLFSSWDEKVENLCISKTIGSGATFSIWLHIFNLCLSTPKFVVFVAMKEYSTLLKTIIDDLEQVILGYKLSNSMPVISLIGKPSRPEGIRFPNGSEIKFLGLRSKNGLSSKKTAEKIEKESPQLFWLSDASELYDFDIWNPIHRILLSQNKQCQIILEAYPKSPKHWIYKLFHSHEPGILDLHEGRDIAINDTIEKCSSMIWLDFKLYDNPVMYQFHDERERKNIAIKLLEYIQIDKAKE